MTYNTRMKGKRILVVDDEKDIVRLLEYNLKKEGYEVLTAATGEEGLKAAVSGRPDLVILDIMLPVLDGFEVCKNLRANPKTAALPVLMLTAKGSETDEVVGLEIGADDYVTKPFKISVLLTRIKKLLQRSKAPAPPAASMKAGALELDPEKQKVRVKGKEVPLTTLEFRILSFMMKNPGKVYTRNQLLDGAWKHEAFVVDRTVDVHIKSIRKKLGPGADCIETVHGSGYRFKEYGK